MEKSIETAHIVIALRRVSPSKNENIGLKKESIRYVVKSNESTEDAIEKLKSTIREKEGMWRIYRTVNKRCFAKARKILMKNLIDRPDEFEYRISSKWKSILMSSDCKAERNFLIDIDTKNIAIVIAIGNRLNNIGVSILEEINTPNGIHFVTTPFDSRGVELEFSDIEVKRDALVFVELIDNKIGVNYATS